MVSSSGVAHGGTSLAPIAVRGNADCRRLRLNSKPCRLAFDVEVVAEVQVKNEVEVGVEVIIGVAAKVCAVIIGSVA